MRFVSLVHKNFRKTFVIIMFQFLIIPGYSFASNSCPQLFIKSSNKEKPHLNLNSPSEVRSRSQQDQHVGLFFHKKNPKLHMSLAVESIQRRQRHMGMTVSQKPAIKLLEWFKYIEHLYLNRGQIESVKKRLRKYYHSHFVIKPEDVPESYFNQLAKQAREQGHGDLRWSEQAKKEQINIIIADQKSSLDQWFNYFTSPESNSFPIWAKYWAFTSILKMTKFNTETESFYKRKKDNIGPFPELNREVLALVVDSFIKKVNKESLEPIKDQQYLEIIDQASFKKLYAYELKNYKHLLLDKTYQQSIEGHWIMYEKGSDATPLVRSLQGQTTGWCTASYLTAAEQLKMGDFYVYYTKDISGSYSVPRIAIRMAGEEIVEIRGIDKEQNIDPQIANSTILSDKLKEFGDKGERYFKKVSDMKFLTLIDHKHQNNIELNREELRFLYELDNKIEGFGYKKDPRIESIKKKRNIKTNLSYILGIPSDKISVTESEALSGKILYHAGDLELYTLTSAKDLKLPERINGSLKLGKITTAKDLKLPQTIGMDLRLANLIAAENLKLPENIGRNLDLSSLTSAKGLKLPEVINGDLDLSGLTSAKGLKLPEVINGNLILSSLTSAKGLKLPHSIGKSLYLNDLTSAKDLKLPERINESLILSNLTYANGLKLPQTIGMNLHLGNLRSLENVKFPETIGGEIFLGLVTFAKEVNLPESVGGGLDLGSLTSAQDVKFPRNIGKTLHLNSLTFTSGLKLPQRIDGNLYLYSLTKNQALSMLLDTEVLGKISFKMEIK